VYGSDDGYEDGQRCCEEGQAPGSVFLLIDFPLETIRDEFFNIFHQIHSTLRRAVVGTV
jgi:hypothetical protein